MPCQHRVYKIFLFFLRNKIKAVIDAKSLKLQGLSAPEAPMSRLRRSSAPFYPDFAGRRVKAARSLNVLWTFFWLRACFLLAKSGQKVVYYKKLGKKRFYRRVEKVESTDFPPSRRKKCRTCRKLSIARIFLSMAVRGSTKTKGAKTWIVCPMGKTQQK